MPAKIWYIDPTQAPGHSDPSWVGPYGTGHRVQAWSQITRSADNWYFGLGGATGPMNTHWDVNQAAVRIGSYGEGRHILDCTNSTVGASSFRMFRLYQPDFKMEYVHMKAPLNARQHFLIDQTGTGQQGFSLKGNLLQGPGLAGPETATAIVNILTGSTPGDWEMIDNEMWDANTGVYCGEEPDKSALFMSNRIRGLTGTDGGNSDGFIFSVSGSVVKYLAFKLKIINNEISGFYDQAIDLISANGAWIEGNKIYNTDVPGLAVGNEVQNTAGMITGGHGSGGLTNSGYHFIARNDIYVQLRPGMTYTGIPAIESRGGNGSTIVANRLVGQGGGWRTTATSGTPDGTLKGRDNKLLNNTLVSLGAGSQDYPIDHKKGVNLSVTNCALIAANSSRAAIDQDEDNLTLRGCVSNSTAWRTGASAGAFDIDGTNTLNATMPSGPDYFPTAALLGAGIAHTRKYADLYGVQLPDNLVGGLAPDARTSALPGVTRKWWKGWAKPDAVLA
jgi:hypothetical protein